MIRQRIIKDPLPSGQGIAHVFTGILHLLSARAVIMPFLAGVLAWRMISLQLRDSAGLSLRITGFAFKPSHPGDRAPERLDYFESLYK
jgi:hypothetical protein